MAEYWREYPPLNEEFARFAQYFGMKKSEAPSSASGEEQHDALFQDLMAGGFSFEPGIL